MKLWAIIFLLFLFTCPAFATGVIGYKVYYGTESGVYGDPVDVGRVYTYTVNLANGTYYFAATAYDSDLLESEYSNEITTTISDGPKDIVLVWDKSVDDGGVSTLNFGTAERNVSITRGTPNIIIQ